MTESSPLQYKFPTCRNPAHEGKVSLSSGFLWWKYFVWMSFQFASVACWAIMALTYSVSIHFYQECYTTVMVGSSLPIVSSL